MACTYTFDRDSRYDFDQVTECFETEAEKAVFKKHLSDAVSDLGLYWLPWSGEIYGTYASSEDHTPVQAFQGDQEAFAEWWEDKNRELWDEYCSGAWDDEIAAEAEQ